MEPQQTMESLRRWIVPKLETEHSMACACEQCLMKAQISVLLFIASIIRPTESITLK